MTLSRPTSLFAGQVGRLVVQHVRAERTELARIERVHKRFLINAQAAAQVDEDRASRHRVERRLVEKAHVVIGQAHVVHDDIGLRQQLFLAYARHSTLGECSVVSVRIAGYHALHEAHRLLGRAFADLAEPERCPAPDPPDAATGAPRRNPTCAARRSPSGRT